MKINFKKPCNVVNIHFSDYLMRNFFVYFYLNNAFQFFFLFQFYTYSFFTLFHV